MIRWFIPRKFAKAANVHLVDSSEEESFQFIFKNVQWHVRWTQLNLQTVPHRTVDQESPVAVARPCSWNVKLMQTGGPEDGTAGAVWRRLTEGRNRKVWRGRTVNTLIQSASNLRAVSGGDVSVHDFVLVQIADCVCQLDRQTCQLLYAQRLQTRHTA